MRACAVLKYTEDMTNEQIGEVLGCGAETVKTQLRRARPRLAELMGMEFHGTDDEDDAR
jgi:DNA-directed RNA polymerase specialized sigma24 family protein